MGRLGNLCSRPRTRRCLVSSMDLAVKASLAAETGRPDFCADQRRQRKPFVTVSSTGKVFMRQSGQKRQMDQEFATAL